MSEILKLAQTLSASSEEQVKNTEKILKDELQKQELLIKAAMKESTERTLKDMQQQSGRFKLLAIKTWLSPLIILIGLILMMWGFLWAQGYTIKKNWKLISYQKQTISDLKKSGATYHWSTCDGKQCIAVDGDQPTFQGKDGQKFIIPEEL